MSVMKKYIPVDIYGPCGDLECSQETNQVFNPNYLELDFSKKNLRAKVGNGTNQTNLNLLCNNITILFLYLLVIPTRFIILIG